MTDFTLALAGDITLGERRLAEYDDDLFLAVIEKLRAADLSIGHLETLLHDYAGEELYPAAEPAWLWARAPVSAAADLGFMGIAGVTLASNHSFDYSYGGLRSTWRALEGVGVAHAGTGLTLDAASAPVFLRAADRTVGLISMTSSAPLAARAGSARPPIPGRPGANTLQYTHVVTSADLDDLLRIWSHLGMWVDRVADDEWWVNPPGLHNTITRYRREDAGITSLPDEHDLQRHLANIMEARSQCDILVTHVHCHEWDPTRGLSYPPGFLIDFAHQAVDAGADVVFSQGAHAPMRGVEVYRNRVIIYDPGDFMSGSSVAALAADWFARHRHGASGVDEVSALSDPDLARAVGSHYADPTIPPGGYFTGGVSGATLVEVEFSSEHAPERVLFTPVVRRTGHGFHEPPLVPVMASANEAAEVLEHLAALSAPFGTAVELGQDGVGVVVV